MAITKAPVFQSNLISLKKLASLSGINYYKIYRRKVGIYKKPLNQNQRTKMANVIVADLAPFFKDLGFEMTIRQKLG